MRFLGIFLLKQNVDKMMITEINCSILESQYTSNDYDMNTGDSKSTSFEQIINT